MIDSGAFFRNLDLHVHTPASDNFTDRQATPEELVAHALAAGLYGIAITDYHSAAWVDRIGQAAQESGLLVFPGVELHAARGKNLLAIFPPATQEAKVEAFLEQIGGSRSDRGSPEALLQVKNVFELIEQVIEQGAVPILAGYDRDSSTWRELWENEKNSIELEKIPFLGAEVCDASLEMDTLPKLVYLHASNSLCLSGIGVQASRFKLNEPVGADDLADCFRQPDVRIRSGKPSTDDQGQHAVLERVQIQGRFLQDLDIRLNPNLNCLIGGRGAGKSTFLEIVRYAFETPAKWENEQGSSLLENNFPPGSQVIVNFRATDGSQYRVVRLAGKRAQVFRGEDTEPALKPLSELLQPDIYGQKEIYEITTRPEYQLNLINNYIRRDLQPLQEQDRQVCEQLVHNAEQIRSFEKDIAAAQDWLERLGAIEQQLRKMENQSFDKRVQQKLAYDQEKGLLDKVEQYQESIRQELEYAQAQILQRPNPLSNQDKSLPNHKILEEIRSSQDELQQQLEADFRQALDHLNAYMQQRKEYQASWQFHYEQQEKDYQALLRDFKDADPAKNPDRYTALSKLHNDLLQRKKLTDQRRAELVKLREKREELFSQLRNIRRQKTQLRIQKAQELSERLRGRVKIEIIPSGSRRVYEAKLQEIFAGLNVRSATREKLIDAKQGNEYLDPIDLSKAIQDEQSGNGQDLLSRQFGIDTENMRRNLASLGENQRYTLELFELPDLPVIQLRIGDEDQYKPLEQLSIGQRCTAVLSMILLENNVPLLIDQPEDDLDNQFVFSQIVATLRSEKERRQFVIATHNPNIVVSGDSELIIAMQANRDRGYIDPQQIGSIDKNPVRQAVERVLEGGEVAFLVRKVKYEAAGARTIQL